MQRQIIKLSETVFADIFGQYELTDREKEVVKMVIEGASNKEIAETLFIAVTTVKKHLSNIFEKMEVSGRGELRVKLLGQTEEETQE